MHSSIDYLTDAERARYEADAREVARLEKSLARIKARQNRLWQVGFERRNEELQLRPIRTPSLIPLGAVRLSQPGKEHHGN